MTTFENIVRAYEKRAGLPGMAWGAAKGVAKGAWNVGAGALGFSAPKGATFGTKALRTAGTVGGLAAPVIGTSMAGSANSSPSVNVGGYAMGKSVQGSLREIEKIGLDGSDVANAVNIASYASMLGGSVLDHHNPWHNRLEGLGLAGLGATTAHSLLTNKDDRVPSAKDLAGLALFAWGLSDRMKASPPDHT